jgi:hypothetical protein
MGSYLFKHQNVQNVQVSDTTTLKLPNQTDETEMQQCF